MFAYLKPMIILSSINPIAIGIDGGERKEGLIETLCVLPVRASCNALAASENCRTLYVLHCSSFRHYTRGQLPPSVMADGVRFELTVELPPRQFSRLVP
jgi:hypothetical protein